MENRMVSEGAMVPLLVWETTNLLRFRQVKAWAEIRRAQSSRVFSDCGHRSSRYTTPDGNMAAQRAFRPL